jgi:hypothetical protein
MKSEAEPTAQPLKHHVCYAIARQDRRTGCLSAFEIFQASAALPNAELPTPVIVAIATSRVSGCGELK